MQHAGIGPFGSAVAGFFEQLALAADERRLVRVELASREFEHHAFERIAVLALQQQAAVVEQRHDHHGAGVVDELARGFAAIGQAHTVAADLEEIAFVDRRGFQPRLDQVLFVTHGERGAGSAIQSPGTPA